LGPLFALLPPVEKDFFMKHGHRLNYTCLVFGLSLFPLLALSLPPNLKGAPAVTTEANPIPEVTATGELIKHIAKGLRQRPGFEIRLILDSKKGTLGPVQKGEARVILPFDEDIEYSLDPLDPTAGKLVASMEQLDVVGNLSMNPDGNFIGSVEFQKLGAATELELAYVYQLDLPPLRLKLNSIRFSGTGAESKAEIITLKGNCGLKQLFLDAAARRQNSFYEEKWNDTICEYEFEYEKAIGRIHFKGIYDSFGGKRVP